MADPTEVFARGKFPFAIVSSSVTTGYAEELSASFGPGYDITNFHQDNYGTFENEPLQGPFTEAHVGGNQHRHAPLNDGNDNILTRAEVFHINTDTVGELRIYGPEVFDTAAARGTMLRGNTAKAPVNIRNIQTTTGSQVHGNFRFNYEVVQTQGRKLNNRYFVEQEGQGFFDDAESIYIEGLVDRALPERDGGKSVISERFNAPGGPDVSSRGVLDSESEEYAPNNALPYRNLAVRGPLSELLTAHTEQFGFSSLVSGAANYHKVHRNTLQRIDPEDTSSCESVYDNWWVQHAIPQSDVQYAWITASADTTACQLAGYQRDGAYTNRGGAYTDITFASSSEGLDHYGLQDSNKDQLDVDTDTNTFTAPSGNISFSTYINGPYGYSSWKQIEGARHPVARALRKNNIISVMDEPKPLLVSQDNGQFTVKAKRGNSSTNYVEPPLSSKYLPIRHRVVLAGTPNPLVGHEIKHSYANNLASYANKELGKKVNVLNTGVQIYDRIGKYYLEDNIAGRDTPVNKFMSLLYSEVVYPKEQNTYLGKTRGRENYIVDLAGFTKDGYDRLFGTQRAFWRDNIEDRHRTPGADQALNSQGYSYVDTSFAYTPTGDTNGDLSLYPLDQRSGLDYSYNSGLGIIFSLFAVKSQINAEYGGELNHQEWYTLRLGSGSQNTGNPLTGMWLIDSRPGHLRESNVLENGNELKQKPRAEYTAFVGGWRYDTGGRGGPFAIGDDIGITSSFDSGLQWRTAELAGKNPWFDSYVDYAQDIRSMAKDHTVVPEFNVSEHMDYYIAESDGNFRRSNTRFLTLDGTGVRDASATTETSSFDSEFFATYAHSDLVKHSDKIAEEHKSIADLSRVTLKCKGIKKLLPYNGFYPSQRTVQLASLLSQSIGTYIKGGSIRKDGAFIYDDPADEQDVSMKLLSLLQPFYAPGILYNSIKSGISVDWPTFTGSISAENNAFVKVVLGDGSPTQETPFKGYLSDTPNYRFPFESIIYPTLAIPKTTENVLNDNGDGIKDGIFWTYPITDAEVSSRNPFMTWDHRRDSRYELAINNFLAEVPKFFLKDQSLLSIRSETSAKWKTFQSSKTYYMDVVLRKTDDLLMMESYRGEYHETGALGQRATGRYFGFPSSLLPSIPGIGSTKPSYYNGVLDVSNVADDGFGLIQITTATPHGLVDGDYVSTRAIEGTVEANVDMNEITFVDATNFTLNGSAFTNAYTTNGYVITESWLPGQHCDPAYAAYTPPYHEGDTIARLSFKPEVTRKYTLEEIFSEIEVENIFIGLENYTGSVAEQGAMPIDSSVNYFGKVREPSLTFDTTTVAEGTFFETQTATTNLDPDSQAWIISPRWECPVLNFENQEGDIADEVVLTSSVTSDLVNLPDFSGSGFGRGMWSGYGEIPNKADGIFLEVRDSFPQRKGDFVTATTASLLDQIGMRPTSEKVGKLADNKIISEAIIAIPFLDKPHVVNGVLKTREIDCKNLITIERDIFKKQSENVVSGKPAIEAGQFESTVDITSTSVSRMVETMKKYVIPPQYNFLEYSDIHPFVMYFLEFEHTLDQQDLADIWQGVMPKIAITAEKDEVEFSHPSGKFEFFGGNEIPENLRWMIFKVKKKAEKDYFAVTADSTDDDRFQFDFKVGRKKPEYSYNWPYDFFSLVELSKVEVELEYKNKDTESVISKELPDVLNQLNKGSQPSPTDISVKRDISDKTKT